MNLDSMEFILFWKNRGWDIYNEPWWICRCWLVHTGLLCIAEIFKLLILAVFGVEHVPKEIEKFIEHKNIKTNIFTIQSNNSIMCGYFCNWFIDFMFAGKHLINFTSLFSPDDFGKNEYNLELFQ